MPEYWTIQQAEANAELFAKEFSNRQILLYGFGEPSMQAPIGVEYEDRNFNPPKRYRKIGTENLDWKPILLIEAASEEEVIQGTNGEKMVTPSTLNNRLNQFSQEILGISENSAVTEDPSTAIVLASTTANNALIEIDLPENITVTVLSVQVTEYGSDSVIDRINGGEVGQIIILRRNLIQPIKIVSSTEIKVSEPIELADTNKFDNITLQRLTNSLWVEIARNQFTE